MSIGFWQILVVLLIILIVFGSSRIKSIGSDLGKALKGFKKEIKDEDDPKITKISNKTTSICQNPILMSLLQCLLQIYV